MRRPEERRRWDARAKRSRLVPDPSAVAALAQADLDQLAEGNRELPEDGTLCPVSRSGSTPRALAVRSTSRALPAPSRSFASNAPGFIADEVLAHQPDVEALELLRLISERQT